MSNSNRQDPDQGEPNFQGPVNQGHAFASPPTPSKKAAWYSRPLVIFPISALIICSVAYFVMGFANGESRYARAADHDARFFAEFSDPQAIRDGVFVSPVLNAAGQEELRRQFEKVLEELPAEDALEGQLLTNQEWLDFEDDVTRLAFLTSPMTEKERLEPERFFAWQKPFATLVEFKQADRAAAFKELVDPRLERFLEDERERIDERLKEIESYDETKSYRADERNEPTPKLSEYEKRRIKELRKERANLDNFVIELSGDRLIMIGNEGVIEQSTARIEKEGSSLADNPSFQSVADLFGRPGISFYFGLHDHYVDLLAKLKRDGEGDEWLEFLRDRVPTESVRGSGMHMGANSMSYRVAVDNPPGTEYDLFGSAGQDIFQHFPITTVQVHAASVDFAKLADVIEGEGKDDLWVKEFYDDAARFVRRMVRTAEIEKLDDEKVKDVLALSDGMVGGGSFVLDERFDVDASVFGVKNIDLLSGMLREAFAKMDHPPIREEIDDLVCFVAEDFAVVLRRDAMILMKAEDLDEEELDWRSIRDGDGDYESKVQGRELAKRMKGQETQRKAAEAYIKAVQDDTIEDAPGFYDAFRDRVDYDDTGFSLVNIHRYMSASERRMQRWKERRDDDMAGGKRFALIRPEVQSETESLNERSYIAKDFWAGASGTYDSSGLNVHVSFGLSDYIAVFGADFAAEQARRELVIEHIDRSETKAALMAFWEKEGKDWREEERRGEESEFYISGYQFHDFLDSDSQKSIPAHWIALERKSGRLVFSLRGGVSSPFGRTKSNIETEIASIPLH